MTWTEKNVFSYSVENVENSDESGSGSWHDYNYKRWHITIHHGARQWKAINLIVNELCFNEENKASEEEPFAR